MDIMKTKTEKAYIFPEVEMCEMLMEAPIASSVGNTNSGGLGVNDGTIDDWETI